MAQSVGRLAANESGNESNRAPESRGREQYVQPVSFSLRHFLSSLLSRKISLSPSRIVLLYFDVPALEYLPILPDSSLAIYSYTLSSRFLANAMLPKHRFTLRKTIHVYYFSIYTWTTPQARCERFRETPTIFNPRAQRNFLSLVLRVPRAFPLHSSPTSNSSLFVANAIYCHKLLCALLHAFPSTNLSVCVYNTPGVRVLETSFTREVSPRRRI